MASGSIDGLRHARCRTIAPAVVRRTQMRSALHDLPRDAYVRHVRIIALVALSASRVKAGAAGLRDLFVLLIPIGGPLPHVTGHVVEPVAIRRKRPHRRRSFKPVKLKILPREVALPSVGHMFAARSKFVTPNELRTIQPSARSELPLGFRWQLFSYPFGIGFNVFVGDMHHGMFRFPLQRACRSLRMPPVRSGNVYPPVVTVSQVHPLARFIENDGGWHEQFRFSSWVILRFRRSLGERDVLGCFDK